MLLLSASSPTAATTTRSAQATASFTPLTLTLPPARAAYCVLGWVPDAELHLMRAAGHLAKLGADASGSNNCNLERHFLLLFVYSHVCGLMSCVYIVLCACLCRLT